MSASPQLIDRSAESTGFAPARSAVDRYGGVLLLRIAAQFGRQRVQSERAELREHMVAAIENPVLIDRTLKSVTPAARRLLRLAGIGRTTRWRVQALVDIGSILQSDAGLEPVRELLEAGLAFPETGARSGRISAADEWLATAAVQPLAIHLAPLAIARSAREPLDLPKVDFDILPGPSVEADGFEWPLRLAVAWQIVHGGPLRLTQQS